MKNSIVFSLAVLLSAFSAYGMQVLPPKKQIKKSVNNILQMHKLPLNPNTFPVGYLWTDLFHISYLLDKNKVSPNNEYIEKFKSLDLSPHVKFMNQFNNNNPNNLATAQMFKKTIIILTRYNKTCNPRRLTRRPSLESD